MISSARLILRPLEERDAAFILELLNDPSFIAMIGDKEVRTMEGARDYISSARASLEERGFGLLAVEPVAGGEVMGICGLVRREGLDGPDLGYALLPRYWGCGYAAEAAQAVLEASGFGCVLAVTNPENEPSIRLLKRLGFAAMGQVELGAGKGPSNLYRWTANV